jgi:hypothetical protein
MFKKEYFVMTCLLALILSASNAQSATYYVATYGSDSNPGTSGSPWQHCPGMSGWSGSATLSAGDTVYFNSSQTWTLSGGIYGFWIEGGVTYIGDTWGNGTRAKFEVASSYLSNGAILMPEDHPSIETEVRGFEVDCNMTESRGIQINYGNRENWHTTGAIKRVQNCHVHHTGSVNASYGIISSTHNDSTTKNIEIINCIVHDCAHNCIGLYAGYASDNDIISDVLIHGNITYNAAQRPSYVTGSGISIKNHVENVIVENNYSYNNKNGIKLQRNDATDLPIRNITIRNNIFRNNENNGIRAAVGQIINVKIYNNLSFNNNQNGIRFEGGLSRTVSFYVYGNTLYDNQDGNINIVSTAATYSPLYIRNNILYPTGISGATGNITAQSNNYTGNPNFKNTSNLPDGFDASGIPNQDGLAPAAGSLALDYGANLGTDYNTSINQVSRPGSGPWDAGAYEEGSADTTPLAEPSGLRIVE